MRQVILVLAALGICQATKLHQKSSSGIEESEYLEAYHGAYLDTESYSSSESTYGGSYGGYGYSGYVRGQFNPYGYKDYSPYGKAVDAAYGAYLSYGGSYSSGYGSSYGGSYSYGSYGSNNHNNAARQQALAAWQVAKNSYTTYTTVDPSDPDGYADHDGVLVPRDKFNKYGYCAQRPFYGNIGACKLLTSGSCWAERRFDVCTADYRKSGADPYWRASGFCYGAAYNEQQCYPQNDEGQYYQYGANRYGPYKRQNWYGHDASFYQSMGFDSDCNDLPCPAQNSAALSNTRYCWEYEREKVCAGNPGPQDGEAYHFCNNIDCQCQGRPQGVNWVTDWSGKTPEENYKNQQFNKCYYRDDQFYQSIGLFYNCQQKNCPN